MKQYVVGFFCSLLLFMGCVPHDEKSQLHHVLGVTTEPRDSALEPCSDDPQHPLLVDYLRSVADHIFGSNPRTFSGPYAPSRFCFTLDSSTEKNASASLNSGLITMNQGIFNSLNSDAAVAAVLTHELAHITLNHGLSHPPEVRNVMQWKALQTNLVQNMESIQTCLEKSRAIFKTIATAESSPLMDMIRSQVSTERVNRLEQTIQTSGLDANGFNALQAYKDLYTEVQQVIEATSPSHEMQALIEQINRLKPDIEKSQQVYMKIQSDISTLELQLTGSYERIRNWREQDADEAGYELYLRAGFEPRSYAESTRNVFFKTDSPDYETCEELLKAGKVPERQFATHPAACWRKFNIEVLESQAHRSAYAELEAKAQTRVLFPGKLEALKAYLKGL